MVEQDWHSDTVFKKNKKKVTLINEKKKKKILTEMQLHFKMQQQVLEKCIKITDNPYHSR